MNDIVLVGFTSVMLLVTENPSPANTHIAYDNILYIYSYKVVPSLQFFLQPKGCGIFASTEYVLWTKTNQH